jgi:hypothetical protein
MTAWLTLATGADRWEEGPRGDYRLKAEGKLWLMTWPDEQVVISGQIHGPFVILKREVADWCFENIRAYRIVEHVPQERFGPDEEDSWRIEFHNDGDLLLFNATWGER